MDIDYNDSYLRIEDLIKFLHKTYTKQTFNPRNNFQKTMMCDIIRHEGNEQYGLNLSDSEITFIQKQINLFE